MRKCRERKKERVILLTISNIIYLKIRSRYEDVILTLHTLQSAMEDYTMINFWSG